MQTGGAALAIFGVGKGLSALGEAAAAEASGAGGAARSNPYEIFDGVKRAKAAYNAGKESIPAQVLDPKGALGAVFDAPVGDLYSPYKDAIELNSSADWHRWNEIVEATQKGEPLPPITVQPGNRGIPIGDVPIE